MADFTSSWEEYRLLVIKELEELNKKVNALVEKIQEVNLNLALIQQNSNKMERNSNKIGSILDTLTLVNQEILVIKEDLRSIEKAVATHDSWHAEERTGTVLQKTRSKDRHWSLFLAIIAVIAAIAGALLR